MLKIRNLVIGAVLSLSLVGGGTAAANAAPAEAAVVTASPAAIHPLASGNWGGDASYWVYLNRAEQAALTAGSGAVVTRSICAIPFINYVGCTVALAATAVAAYFIMANGYCSNQLALLVAGPWWERSHCV